MAEAEHPGFQQGRSPIDPGSELGVASTGPHQTIASALNASFRSNDDVPGDWSRLLSRLL